MDRKVLKNSKWKHFKGNEYIVLDIAKHTETKESMVIYYRENDENQINIRIVSRNTDLS